MTSLTATLCGTVVVMVAFQISGGFPIGQETKKEKGLPPGAPLLLDGDSHVVLRVLQSETTTEGPTTTTPAPSKSFSQLVAEFYSDDNNLAMFLVLPLIVLIYGGCSAIYCVAKCRRYFRRRRHKKLKETQGGPDKNQNEPTNDLNQEGRADEEQQQKPTHSNVNTSFSDIRVNMISRNTPLPGMPVQEEVEPISETTAAANNAEVRAAKTSSRSEAVASPKPRNVGEPYMLSSRSTSQRSMTSEGSVSCDKRREEIPLVTPVHSKSDAFKIQNRIFTMTPRSESGSRSGRSSALAYKEELMAKYEALTTLAMAKKAADILRMNTDATKLDRKKPRQKMIFIAE